MSDGDGLTLFIRALRPQNNTPLSSVRQTDTISPFRDSQPNSIDLPLIQNPVRLGCVRNPGVES